MAARLPSKPTSPRESALFYEALQELLRIYQFRDRERSCYGSITPNDCYALEAIERAGALRVNDLAAALGLHKSNASRLAADLVARGLVRRDEDGDDPRAARLQLTEAGERAHAAVRDRVQAAHRAILDRFPPAQRRAFVELLSSLAVEARQRVGKRSATDATQPTGETSCSSADAGLGSSPPSRPRRKRSTGTDAAS
jgi:DNA-binding MarR family transcriptional regulator